MTNGAIAKMVERATGGKDSRSPTDCLEEFARTVTVRFFPASKYWVMYAKPLTTDSGLWEDGTNPQLTHGAKAARTTTTADSDVTLSMGATERQGLKPRVTGQARLESTGDRRTNPAQAQKPPGTPSRQCTGSSCTSSQGCDDSGSSCRASDDGSQHGGEGLRNFMLPDAAATGSQQGPDTVHVPAQIVQQHYSQDGARQHTDAHATGAMQGRSMAPSQRTQHQLNSAAEDTLSQEEGETQVQMASLEQPVAERQRTPQSQQVNTPDVTPCSTPDPQPPRRVTCHNPEHFPGPDNRQPGGKQKLTKCPSRLPH
ncbi:hypothetical protein C8R45DRAFT_937419 [Mycena sanguinolenta]|nr:hypothetical protein C8R45DRAFT_937419 [Mycena sanguinolenta]